MPEYPVISLNNEIVIQPATTTDTFRIIQIVENPGEMWVHAFVSIASEQVWVTVLDGDTYFTDWTDETVTDAVTAWAEANFHPAPGE
jgi:hypothetical protein